MIFLRRYQTPYNVNESSLIPQTSILGPKLKEMERDDIITFQSEKGISIIKAFLKTHSFYSFLKEPINEIALLYPVVEPFPYFTNVTSNWNLESLLEDEGECSFDTIYKYHSSYRNREKTPKNVMLNLFDLLESDKTKDLGIIVKFSSSRMLKEAEKSTRRYREGKHLSLIDGIPFFVSEEFFIKDYECLNGSQDFEVEPGKTSHCLKKLTDNGAILCGYTNTAQFGLNLMGINPNKNHKQGTRNPYNNSYYVSGGSPGSSASVVYGLCPFSIGLDKFGALRIGAGSGGGVSFRPTYGRYSMKNGAFCSTSPFWQPGAITCCVRDSLLIYSFMASGSTDIKKLIKTPQPIIPRLNLTSFKEIRFGTFPLLTNMGHKRFAKACSKVLDLIAYHDGKVVSIKMPDLKESMCATFIGETYISYLSASFQYGEDVIDTNDIYSNFLLMLGKILSQADMHKVNCQRNKAVKDFQEMFEKIDILVMPSTAFPPVLIQEEHKKNGYLDDQDIIKNCLFYFIPSLAGLPAITLHIDYLKEEGLPISIQLIGKWWKEDILFKVARLLEKLIQINRAPKSVMSPFTYT